MWLDAIWRYPVKSAAGERLEAAHLGELGVPGDRLVYVVDGRGRTVSARNRPKLLGLRGGVDADGSPTVDGHTWDDPAAAELVRAAAGPSTRLVSAGSYERFDILPLLVATDGAATEAGLDIRRLRPNLVIGGVDRLAERGWEGRFLRVGDAVVGLDTLRGRCIVTTYDPDTVEQDVQVLIDIQRRFAGSLALNAWTVPRRHATSKRVRVEAARDLLETGDMTVAGIAERCGFGSPETMRRAFRRVPAGTPTEIRARFRSTGDEARIPA